MWAKNTERTENVFIEINIWYTKLSSDVRYGLSISQVTQKPMTKYLVTQHCLRVEYAHDIPDVPRNDTNETTQRKARRPYITLEHDGELDAAPPWISPAHRRT